MEGRTTPSPLPLPPRNEGPPARTNMAQSNDSSFSSEWETFFIRRWLEWLQVLITRGALQTRERLCSGITGNVALGTLA